MTLKQIFESQTSSLRKELDGLSLPKDAGRIEKIVSTNLSDLFNDDGEYRQNLTQSEDYILQAALSLLKAQQEISISIADAEMPASEIPSPASEKVENNASAKTDNANPFAKEKVSGQNALLGSAGGALAGNLLFGGWGAVFGAIAGTALVIYVASNQKPKMTSAPKAKPSQSSEVNNSNCPIDVEKFITIIGGICESVDNLIETFRVQIRKVVTKYESQEKPTIERDYRVLLEGIQSLIGYKRGHSPEDEKYLPKLQTRIEDIAELLDNYDLEAVDYTPEHSEWFEAVESKNATDIKMVTPAITKNGNLVLKGKIFIPVK